MIHMKAVGGSNLRTGPFVLFFFLFFVFRFPFLFFFFFFFFVFFFCIFALKYYIVILQIF